eukprot:UN08601
MIEDEPDKDHGIHSINKGFEWRDGYPTHLGPQDSRHFIDQCSRLMVLTSVFTNKAPYTTTTR